MTTTTGGASVSARSFTYNSQASLFGNSAFLLQPPPEYHANGRDTLAFAMINACAEFSTTRDPTVLSRTTAGHLQRSRRIFSDKRRLDAVQEQTRIEGKAANFDVLGRINIPCWIIHFEYATDRSV